MTFGDDWGWGAGEDAARQLFSRYIEWGGNFIDTADLYTNGRSEEMVGNFVKDAGLRDKVAIATKFTYGADAGNPNGGGNGRKNMMRAIEGSLKRLQTDYVDLYWVHVWDTLTPVEEVVSSLNSLVQQGKTRYIGLSNCPAWYVAQANTIARLRGYEPIVAMQLEYNLTERSIEREHIPLALHHGMGITPWSPLAMGLLTGKYTRDSIGEGRLKAVQGSGNPVMEKFAKNPKNWDVVDVVKDVAQQVGRPPAQVALNWIARRPGVASTLVGATKLHQLEDNLAALDFDIPAELSDRLEAVSRPEDCSPYNMFAPAMLSMTTGGTTVRG
jgi:aryl-alcohol dehydrogenase-like predicted oxidoreductase